MYWSQQLKFEREVKKEPFVVEDVLEPTDEKSAILVESGVCRFKGHN
jgi:predicted transcriptional regulator